MRVLPRFIWATAVLAAGVVAPRPAFPQLASDDWLIGIGAGVASRDQSLDETWVSSLVVSRRIGASTWLQTAVDYFGEGTSMVSAEMACSAVGVRYQFDPDERVHPYVEALPALFIGRWTDKFFGASATNLSPGLTGGMGLMGPVGGRFCVDVGLRGYLSADWPTVGPHPSVPDYDGVKRWTLGGKVLYGF